MPSRLAHLLIPGLLATVVLTAQSPADLRVDGDRLNAHLSGLGQIGATPEDGTHRVAHSDADRQGRARSTVSVSTQGDDCARLAGTEIPASAIGLPTSGAVIQSATLVLDTAANNRNGEYCLVKGQVLPKDPAAPSIEYEVNLPAVWNGKAVQFGGGGYDGTLVTGLNVAPMHPSDLPSPLKLGYITLGSDSGHKAAQADWALNDEALANFGNQQIKKVHDVAVALAKGRYGRAPTRFYFIGNSQGGHEALDAAARYPADYDGVVATHPAYDLTLLHLASLKVIKAGAANNGAGWLSPNKHALVKALAMQTCDALDGLVDQIISNLPACRQTMTVENVRSALRCAGGADTGDACLSDAQIGAVAEITAPYRPGFSIAGMDEIPGWGMLEGADLPLGSRAVPTPPLGRGDSFYATIAATTVQYVITRNPAFDILTFDPAQFRARTEAVGRIMDVTDQDLTPFSRRGGKIIMTHGTADQLIMEGNSEAYYRRQLATFGKATLDSFLRFYVIPGFSHGGGTFTARYDALSQLENWVEKNTPPSTFETIDENAATKGRTRPMCLYGTYPKFVGAAGASMNDAADFACVNY